MRTLPLHHHHHHQSTTMELKVFAQQWIHSSPRGLQEEEEKYNFFFSFYLVQLTSSSMWMVRSHRQQEWVSTHVAVTAIQLSGPSHVFHVFSSCGWVCLCALCSIGASQQIQFSAECLQMKIEKKWKLNFQWISSLKLNFFLVDLLGYWGLCASLFNSHQWTQWYLFNIRFAFN